jgi:hypothetical protein
LQLIVVTVAPEKRLGNESGVAAPYKEALMLQPVMKMFTLEEGILARTWAISKGCGHGLTSMVTEQCNHDLPSADRSDVGRQHP